MQTLSPRAAAAIVMAPFAILALEWAQRDAPPACADTRAWVSGLAPAAFVTGCVCLVVSVRISAMEQGGRAGAPTLAAVAAWLAAAVAWWWQGESSPLSWWALLSYVLLLAAVPAGVALGIAIAIRPSWALVRALAWLSAVVLVPGLVTVVEMWGGLDFNC